MNEITISANSIPVTFEDVTSFAIVAQEKLKSVRAEISAIKRLGLAQEVLQQKIKEAQELAEVKTRAEMQIGKLTAAMPKASGVRNDLVTSTATGSRLETKRDALNKAGIRQQAASEYERMAAHPDIVEKVITEARENDDIISRSTVMNRIKLEEKKETIRKAEQQIANQATEDTKPILFVGDGIGWMPREKYDLLLTDPPYMTDIDDMPTFVNSWLCDALDGVKDTGFAYIFIGAYPDEVKAYLNASIPEHMHLEQILVWTYKNTLGQNPKDRYKQNYQNCLFYRGVNAPDLDCPLTSEQWAVQEINAPDGRQGDRYHAWQKPMEIAERFIRHSTKLGDIVFDPFACTGTFLLAASKLGRRAYGFEIDPDNAEIAFERGCQHG